MQNTQETKKIIAHYLHKATSFTWANLLSVANNQQHNILLEDNIEENYHITVECFKDTPKQNDSDKELVLRIAVILSGKSLWSQIKPLCEDILVQEKDGAVVILN